MPVWSGRPKSLKRIVPVRMSTLFRYRMKTVYAPMSPMLSVPYIAKMRMLAFLQSSQGQDAYAKFGFVKASETELKPQTDQLTSLMASTSAIGTKRAFQP
jgi:hypothetical protein